MLSAETKDEIRTLVRGGFYDRHTILQMLCEEMGEPSDLPADEVSVAVEEEFRQLNLEKANWPKLTDCDRLDQAFEVLSERGIIALQNAGYTQSDGVDEVQAAYVDVEDEEQIIGYCFFHAQDVARAIHGGGLYIAFGPADPKDEETKGPAVGEIVCEELKRAGLDVVWNGTFKERIFIPNLQWQRR